MEYNNAELKDILIGSLIGLARTCSNNPKTDKTDMLIIDGLRAVMPDNSIGADILGKITDRINEEKAIISPGCVTCTARCGNTDNYDMSRMWNAGEDIRYLKTVILSGIIELSVSCSTVETNEKIMDYIYRSLYILAEDWGKDEILPYVYELGKINCEYVFNN